MKTKHLKNSNLFEEFSQRIKKRSLFCFQSHQNDYIKFERIHNYCLKHGFILNHSTINMIQTSLTNIITSAFDYNIQDKNSNIQLELTHVNALPNRTEQGIFLIIELGNINEDVRYTLVSLLGKHIPSYDILHSQGYNLPEQIRISHGTLLLDQLAIGLKDFLEQVSNKLPRILSLGLLVHFPIKQNELNHAEILSWSNRFNCPDLLHQDIIILFNRSIEQYISPYYHLNLIACIQESVAALISVAYEYPNTLISLIFKNKFQLSFVEDTDKLFYRTILSFNFQYIHSNKSLKTHALFQTLLTSIDLFLMNKHHINYFDILTCDIYLIEILRLLIINLYHHEKLFSYEFIRKLNNYGSLSIKFLLDILQKKYSKIKIFFNKLGLKKISKSYLIYIEYISHIIIQRSTQILSCLIICLSDYYNQENITIAIDSYLYHLCPIYQIYMNKQIEYLCKRWITMFHFVNATNKSYLGSAAIMSLQKTMINQDDNISRLFINKNRRRYKHS